MADTQTAAKWEMRDGVLCYAGKATLIQTIFGLDATLDLTAKLNSHAALAAENQRLREALEFIGYTQNIQAANDTAREALGVQHGR